MYAGIYMSGVISRERKRESEYDQQGFGPADFIEQQDQVLMELCFSTYEHLITERNGWELAVEGSVFCRSWVQGTSVIIGIRGTVLFESGGLMNLADDAVIAGLIGNDRCALSIVADATKYLELFIERGFTEIIVCGHSLGGEAAFCLAKQFIQVTRAVSFNGAAPASGGIFIGAGRDRSRAYHIVGDVVSTHIDGDTCDVRRIKLLPELTNWGDPLYYHKTDRFQQHHREWVLWSAQDEQDDMQDYVFNSTAGSTVINLLLGVVTKYLNIDRLREFICEHPIPGSVSGPECSRDYGLGRGGHILGAFAGGLLGLVLGGTAGLAALGVGGLATGAVAGYKLAKGEGLLDLFFDNRKSDGNKKKV